jgi:hypothetical protein
MSDVSLGEKAVYAKRHQKVPTVCVRRAYGEYRERLALVRRSAIVNVKGFRPGRQGGVNKS